MAGAAQAENNLAAAARRTTIWNPRTTPTSTSISPLSHPLSGSGSSPPRDRPLGWLLVILVVGTLLRVWVWRGHAIDPDEGAHLMDTRLLLRGLVPYADFQPRGIIYLYILAAFVRLVGPDYSLVRLCVVLTEPLTGALIFLLARRLLDGRVGLLAAATYLLFPLTIRSSSIVHMEPFAILSACGVAYLLVRHLEPGGGWGALFAAGFLIAVGIYVRESGVAIALSAILTLTVWTWGTPRLLLRRYAVLLAGFLVPCAAIGLPYARLFSPSHWWRSPVNPFYVLVRHTQVISLTGWRAADPVALTHGPAGTFQQHAQAWSTTWHSFHDTFFVFGPLFVALVLSIGLVVAGGRDPRRAPGYRLAGAVLYPWVLALALAYGYWTVYRGFFPEYAVELVPPLAIIFGLVLAEFSQRFESGPLLRWAILLVTAYALVVYLAFPPETVGIPRYLYFAIPPLALAPPWNSGKRGSRWWPALALVGLAVLVQPRGLPYAVRSGLKAIAVVGLVVGGWAAARTQQSPGRPRPGLLAYAGLVLLGATVGVAFDVASHSVGLRFGSVWPQSTVREIAAELRRRGRETDEVLSGAVIWEYQAGLQPFARLTHPLKFEFGITPREAEALTRRLRTTPPRFVVFDGYTERTYGRVLPVLADVVKDRYELVATAAGGEFPVRLYQLREPTTSP